MSIFEGEGIFTQFVNVNYRFFTGLFGCLSLIGLLERMASKMPIFITRKAQKFGRETGSVYILSSIIFIYSFKFITYKNILWTATVSDGLILSVCILLPVSILMIELLIYLKKWIVKKKILGFVLLGEKYE